jgi:hypothetical protein
MDRRRCTSGVRERTKHTKRHLTGMPLLAMLPLPLLVQLAVD